MIYQSVSREKKNDTYFCKQNLLQKKMKRGEDILCSGVGLIVLCPIYLVIFISLKIWGEGSAIFSQERIGKDGKPFTIYKFRTMRIDAEAGGPQLAIKNDERMTKIGRFLRKHHLDELPQFWNILKGDMSIVGYRPERQFFIDKIMKKDQRYELLFAMRPGLTSEATLYNGYTNSLDKMLLRLQMDLDYMKNPSILKDLNIIFKTMIAIIFTKSER